MSTFEELNLRDSDSALIMFQAFCILLGWSILGSESNKETNNLFGLDGGKKFCFLSLSYVSNREVYFHVRSSCVNLRHVYRAFLLNLISGGCLVEIKGANSC